MGATLEKVATVAELAKMSGWSYDRMLRHLKATDEASDGGLLVNVGRGGIRPRWTVSLARLKSMSPNWFKRSGEFDVDWEDFDTRVRRLELRIEELSRILLSRGAHSAR